MEDKGKGDAPFARGGKRLDGEVVGAWDEVDEGNFGGVVEVFPVVGFAGEFVAVIEGWGIEEFAIMNLEVDIEVAGVDLDGLVLEGEESLAAFFVGAADIDFNEALEF